ncbi:activator of Hsp90 ATPase [Dentipellis sp. KUC8613]|nr:activator of Hsp90 ATPase [Dentipellis sp. KUC8613]
MSYGIANWHWKNKTVTPWAKAWFERELVRVAVPDSDAGKDAGKDEAGKNAGEGEKAGVKVKVKVDRVVEVEGDVELGRRKSKLITIYDCKVVLQWSGTAADGSEVVGRLVVPEVSHEITLDGLSDYSYEWSLTSERTPAAEPVLALAKAKLPAALEAVFKAFPPALIETHGKDVLADASRTGSPAPTTSTPSAPSAGSASTTSTGVTGTAAGGVGAGEKKEKERKEVKKKSVNTALVEVEAAFQASADDLFSILTDEKRIPMWSRAPAKSEAKAGTEYALFSGGVRGKYISLTPGKEIKQTWALQSPTWPSGHEATFTIRLDQLDDSTKVTFSLDGVPTGMEDELRQNLEGYYIHGLKSIGLGSVL